MKNKIIGALSVVVLLAAAQPSHATLKLQKAAKEAGIDAANCMYCHNEKMPAKGKVTYNARGEFLVKQKEVKKAKEVDVAWLKEFVESKK